MPAYQSTIELGLSQKYHLKAVECEEQADRATDPATEQQWQQLAFQWRSMAEQASRISDDVSLDDELRRQHFLFKSDRH